MDKSGRWHLSPAYDITYAYDASNRWLARHQMTINGKTTKFSKEDLLACVKRMNLSKARMSAIMEEVRHALDLWDSCAGKAWLEEQEMEYIKKQFEEF